VGGGGGGPRGWGGSKGGRGATRAVSALLQGVLLLFGEEKEVVRPLTHLDFFFRKKGVGLQLKEQVKLADP